MGRQRKSAKTRRKLAKSRQEARKLRGQIRHDFERPADEAWGTSPQALGEVKRNSEEAHHVVCPECGYSGGRHAGMCSR